MWFLMQAGETKRKPPINMMLIYMIIWWAHQGSNLGPAD